MEGRCLVERIKGAKIVADYPRLAEEAVFVHDIQSRVVQIGVLGDQAWVRGSGHRIVNIDAGEGQYRRCDWNGARVLPNVVLEDRAHVRAVRAVEGAAGDERCGEPPAIPYGAVCGVRFRPVFARAPEN